MRKWKLLIVVLTVASCLGFLFFLWLIQPLLPLACRYAQNLGTSSVDRSSTSDTSGFAEKADRNELILHYVRLYANRASEVPLRFLDCLAVYSAILNLKPSIIYLHTNRPTPFPFQRCEVLLNVTITWPPIRTVVVPLEFAMKGQHIRQIAHEADIRKLKAVEMYGGIVLDFDVFVINGSSLREALRMSECVICDENHYAPIILNAGLLGCRKKHARFPQLVLDESYKKDYVATNWIHNSGVVPRDILQRHNDTATVLDGVCNHDKGNWSRNFESRNWKSLPAYHSYVHDNLATRENVRKLNDPLGEITRWLLSDSSNFTVIVKKFT